MLVRQDKRLRHQGVKKAIQAKEERCIAETAEFDQWGKAEHELSVEQVIY